MANINVTVDYVTTDSSPAAPIWTATDTETEEPERPIDVWCLMSHIGTTICLASTYTRQRFCCETVWQGVELEDAIARYMAQTLGAMVSTFIWGHYKLNSPGTQGII